MRKIVIICFAAFSLAACNASSDSGTTSMSSPSAPQEGGQSTVEDNESQKDVVKIAVGSKDHTTLVAALKAAEYVDVLSNAGPFTVFAPTNDAFNKLPAGTVEGLLIPEKKSDLRNILEYHVFVGVLKPELLQDGQSYGQANGDNIRISIKDGKIQVNGANIITSIPASNGIIHVVDAVLLPPTK